MPIFPFQKEGNIPGKALLCKQEAWDFVEAFPEFIQAQALSVFHYSSIAPRCLPFPGTVLRFRLVYFLLFRRTVLY